MLLHKGQVATLPNKRQGTRWATILLPFPDLDRAGLIVHEA